MSLNLHETRQDPLLLNRVEQGLKNVDGKQKLVLSASLPEDKNWSSMRGLYIERLRTLASGGLDLAIYGVPVMKEVVRDNLGNSSVDGSELTFRMCAIHGFKPPIRVVDVDVVIPTDIITGVQLSSDAGNKSHSV